MPTHATTRPQPLLTRAGVVSAIAGLVSLLVTFGVLPEALGDQITTSATVVVGAVFTIITAVAPLVHALVSRSAVTPVADPKDNDGNDLVPAGSEVAVTEDASAALAEADAVYPQPIGHDRPSPGILATGSQET